MYGVQINQNHDSELDNARIGITPRILKSSLRLYVKKRVLNITLINLPHIGKTDFADGGMKIDVLLLNGPMRNHYHMDFCEETQDINLGTKNVPRIQCNMLA